jgi:hypothetical protein
MPVIRVGPWPVARRILATAAPRLQRAIGQAVMQEAQALRAEIIGGLTSQAPGGDPIKPLAASTIAKRRLLRFSGTKALIVRSDLRRSVTVQDLPGFGAFVGVNRTARGRGGQLLANVAELNEFGSRPIAIRITPRMRRFLMALRGAGGGAGGEGAGGGGGGAGGAGGGPGIVIVQIPARPFIRPAADKLFGNREQVSARFLGRISRLLGGDFGHV